MFKRRPQDRKHSGAVVLITVVALILASCAGGSTKTSDTNTDTQGISDTSIKLGAFGPLTGETSWIGLGARSGLELATDQINEHGGINGRKIELKFISADGPAESLSAARQLVERDKVYALLIGGGSTGAAAVADYARSNGIPTYNMLGATPTIREPFSTNIFHGAGPSAPALAQYLVDGLAQSKPRPQRVGVIHGTYEYPKSEYDVVKPLISEKGYELVADEAFDLGDTDFTAQLAAMSSANVDAVVFLGHFTEGALILRQASAGALPDVQWVIDSASAIPGLPEAVGEAADGTISYFIMPQYLGESADPMESFEMAWRQKFGEPPKDRPNYLDLAGYGDLFVLANVIKAAGEDLTWGNLISTWNGMKEVSPSDFAPYGLDVIFPESFSSENHQGNRCHATIQIRTKAWQVIGENCDTKISDN